MLDGTFTQLGPVTATNSTLNLAGDFVLSDLGTLAVTGGPVNLSGTLTNLGTLDLGIYGVSWNLAGGTIDGVTAVAAENSTPSRAI